MSWVQSPSPLRNTSDSVCPRSLLCTQSASFARLRAALDLRSHAVSASLQNAPNIDPVCSTLPARSWVHAFTVSDIHRSVIIRDREKEEGHKEELRGRRGDREEIMDHHSTRIR